MAALAATPRTSSCRCAAGPPLHTHKRQRSHQHETSPPPRASTLPRRRAPLILRCCLRVCAQQGISQLLRLANRRGHLYDRMIIELSGVAEPKNIRREFVEAAEAGHIALNVCELQTMITVVDSPSFSELYSSKESIQNRPDLCAEDGGEQEAIDSERKVVDLLVEQIECADFIVLNKKDKCADETMDTLAGIAANINPTAQVVTAEWGKVPLDTVFGAPKSGSWVCKADDEDDLRDAVAAAKQLSKKRKASETAVGHGTAGHEHGHGHAHEHGGVQCTESHGEAHGHTHEHGGVPCTETHGHGGAASDTSRQASTTAAQKYGITSFVYSRRRPFHPQRLMKVILQLPVKVDPNSGDLVDNWELPGAAGGEAAPAEASVEGGPSVMRAVIRSKGFVWVANQHRSAQYWSHAGHYFELRALGLWWAATALEQWPDQGKTESKEVKRIVDDFAPQADAAAKWGDRRQEVVFIGIGMKEDKIEELLDTCLLSDQEMLLYQSQAEKAPPDVVALDFATMTPKIASA